MTMNTRHLRYVNNITNENTNSSNGKNNNTARYHYSNHDSDHHYSTWPMMDDGQIMIPRIVGTHPHSLGCLLVFVPWFQVPQLSHAHADKPLQVQVNTPFRTRPDSDSDSNTCSFCPLILAFLSVAMPPSDPTQAKSSPLPFLFARFAVNSSVSLSVAKRALRNAQIPSHPQMSPIYRYPKLKKPSLLPIEKDNSKQNSCSCPMLA